MLLRLIKLPKLPIHHHLIFILPLVLVISIAATIAFGKNITEKTSLINETSKFTGDVPINQDILESDGNIKTLGVVLLGYGGAGHSGGFLTDAIQVVNIDFEKKYIALISIPRDLWVTLPSGQAAKINQAYSQDNGVKTIADMAGLVTGVPIDYYIGVDFVGFQRAIGEELDGIEVQVSETLDDPWYPVRGLEQEFCDHTPEEVTELSNTLSGFELEKQFPCRYKHVYFEPGLVHMEGGEALEFVRSRHGSAGGDFSRSKRQHELLLAIKNKLLDLKALDNSVKFFESMLRTITTNLDVNAVMKLTPLLIEAKDFEVRMVTLNTENVFINSKSASGQFILQPKTGANDWLPVHNFVSSELE